MHKLQWSTMIRKKPAEYNSFMLCCIVNCMDCCRIVDLLVEAESTALQPLLEAATVIQKHWRGLKVSHMPHAILLLSQTSQSTARLRCQAYQLL